MQDIYEINIMQAGKNNFHKIFNKLKKFQLSVLLSLLALLCIKGSTEPRQQHFKDHILGHKVRVKYPEILLTDGWTKDHLVLSVTMPIQADYRPC